MGPPVAPLPLPPEVLLLPPPKRRKRRRRKSQRRRTWAWDSASSIKSPLFPLSSRLFLEPLQAHKKIAKYRLIFFSVEVKKKKKKKKKKEGFFFLWKKKKKKKKKKKS